MNIVHDRTRTAIVHRKEGARESAAPTGACHYTIYVRSNTAASKREQGIEQGLRNDCRSPHPFSAISLHLLLCVVFLEALPHPAKSE